MNTVSQIKSTHPLDEVLEIFDYDDREPPNWHRFVGDATLDGDVLVLSRSWADPRKGTNQQRLSIKPTNKGVKVTGYGELGNPFNFHLDDETMEKVAHKLLEIGKIHFDEVVRRLKRYEPQ